MIALDTNVLIRYLVRDDPEQSARAKRLLWDQLTPEQPGFVTIATVVELCWVLNRAYKTGSAEIRSIIAQLRTLPQILFEQDAVIERALALNHAELADAIIHESGRASGCAKTVTFDRRFARLPDVELL